MTSAPEYNQIYLRALSAVKELIDDASSRGAKVAEVRIKPAGTLLDIRLRTIEDKPIKFIEVTIDPATYHQD